jgi:hypothetical protein
MAIHNAATSDGTLSIGADELADRTGLHPSSVRKFLKQAEAGGWLKRITTGGTTGLHRGEVSRFAFTVPQAVAVTTARPRGVVTDTQEDTLTTAPQARRSPPTTAPQTHDHRASGATSPGSDQVYKDQPTANGSGSVGRSSTESKKPAATAGRSRSPSEQIRQDDPDGWAAAVAVASKAGKGTNYAVGVYRNRQNETAGETADRAHLAELAARPCPNGADESGTYWATENATTRTACHCPKHEVIR